MIWCDLPCGRSLVDVGRSGRFVPEHDPVLDHVAIWPELLQILFLKTQFILRKVFIFVRASFETTDRMNIRVGTD